MADYAVIVAVALFIVVVLVRERVRAKRSQAARNLTEPPAPVDKPPRQSDIPQRAKTASDWWDDAISQADSGNEEDALLLFARAIEANPDYYISVIQPRTTRARLCWDKAVKHYLQKTSTLANEAVANTRICIVCKREIGSNWHYDFESIVFSSTVAAQCPSCGTTTCSTDLVFAADGNYPPCPRCNVRLVTLSEGPSYSSMVEQARRERRYRGALKEPAALQRVVKVG